MLCLLAEVYRRAGRSFTASGGSSHTSTCSKLIISAALKPGSSRYLLSDDFVYPTRYMAQSTANAKTYSSVMCFLVFTLTSSSFVFSDLLCKDLSVTPLQCAGTSAAHHLSCAPPSNPTCHSASTPLQSTTSPALLRATTCHSALLCLWVLLQLHPPPHGLSTSYLQSQPSTTVTLRVL